MTVTEQEKRTVFALAREGHGLARRALELWNEAARLPCWSPGRRHLRRAGNRAARRALAGGAVLEERGRG